MDGETFSLYRYMSLCTYMMIEFLPERFCCFEQIALPACVLSG